MRAEARRARWGPLWEPCKEVEVKLWEDGGKSDCGDKARTRLRQADG